MSKHILQALGADPETKARRAAQARLLKERTERVRGISQLVGRESALGRGIAAGELAGQVVNKISGADATAIDESQEVVAARNNAMLLRTIQGLTQGDSALQPGTSEFAAAAGRAAQDAGRTDLALQFASQSAGLRKGEATAAAKFAKDQRASEQASFNGLPNSVQLSVSANDPDRVAQLLDLTPEQAKQVSIDAQATLKTLQLKNQKALDELKAVRVTKSSPEDIVQTIGLLANRGIGGFSFEGNFGKDDPQRLEDFAALMDQQATAELDAAARRGDRITKNQVYDEILSELNSLGGIEGFNTEDVSGIDLSKLQEVFTARSQDAPAANIPDTAKPRRRVVVSP